MADMGVDPGQGVLDRADARVLAHPQQRPPAGRRAAAGGVVLDGGEIAAGEPYGQLGGRGVSANLPSASRRRTSSVTER